MNPNNPSTYDVERPEDAHATHWNYSLCPGWTHVEARVLRFALMKYGVGNWAACHRHFSKSGKTLAQMSLQAQRLFGQQGLAVYNGLHLDPEKIWFENDKIRGQSINRKNGCIINEAGNMNKIFRALREKYIEKYELPKEVIENLVVPSCSSKDEVPKFIEFLKSHPETQYDLTKPNDHTKMVERYDKEFWELGNQMTKNGNPELFRRYSRLLALRKQLEYYLTKHDKAVKKFGK